MLHYYVACSKSTDIHLLLTELTERRNFCLAHPGHEGEQDALEDTIIAISRAKQKKIKVISSKGGITRETMTVFALERYEKIWLERVLQGVLQGCTEQSKKEDVQRLLSVTRNAPEKKSALTLTLNAEEGGQKVAKAEAR